MRAGCHRSHEDDVAGKDVEKRQRAHDVVVLREQQFGSDPPVVNHSRIPVLRDFRHAGRTAGVEIAGDPVAGAVGEVQCLRVLGNFSVEVEVFRLVLNLTLWPDERHDP